VTPALIARRILRLADAMREEIARQDAAGWPVPALTARAERQAIDNLKHASAMLRDKAEGLRA